MSVNSVDRSYQDVGCGVNLRLRAVRRFPCRQKVCKPQGGVSLLSLKRTALPRANANSKECLWAPKNMMEKEDGATPEICIEDNSITPRTFVLLLPRRDHGLLGELLLLRLGELRHRRVLVRAKKRSETLRPAAKTLANAVHESARRPVPLEIIIASHHQSSVRRPVMGGQIDQAAQKRSETLSKRFSVCSVPCPGSRTRPGPRSQPGWCLPALGRVPRSPLTSNGGKVSEWPGESNTNTNTNTNIKTSEVVPWQGRG